MTEKRMLVIARPQVGAGFHLAGATVVAEPDGAGAAERLQQLQSDVDVGVVLVEDTLYRDLPEEFARTLRQWVSPIVVPIPGPSWSAESGAADYIVQILQRAIGYRVRLQ